MKTRRLHVAAMMTGLLLAVLSHVAVSDPVFLGSFDESFTTFSSTGELSYPGELDWYLFTVGEEASTIRVQVAGPDTGDSVRALLFNDDESYIDTTVSGRLDALLSPGSYRLRVDSMDSLVQSYSLVAFNGIETESNDGVSESNDLGDLLGPMQLAASLLPAGDADFFRFAIPPTGLGADREALIIETEGLIVGDTAITLYLYSESEERYLPILSDDDSGDEVWSRLLLRPSEGDEYIIRVEETYYPLDGIDDYELSIRPVALSLDREPNDISAQAVVLESSSTAPAVWNHLGLLDEDDTIDFYRMSIASSAMLQIHTESQGDAGDYDTVLTLYSASGDTLATNNDGGNAPWSQLTLAVDAGDYYVTVEADDGSHALIPYGLRAVAYPVKIVGETEPNDTDETAESITWIDGEALLIEGRLDVEGDIDSFKLVLNEAATLAFETGPPSGTTEDSDTTLALYDAELWEIASNDDANGSWSRIEENLIAGTYYIVVDSYFGDDIFDYTLLIADTDEAP